MGNLMTKMNHGKSSGLIDIILAEQNVIVDDKLMQEQSLNSPYDSNPVSKSPSNCKLMLPKIQMNSFQNQSTRNSRNASLNKSNTGENRISPQMKMKLNGVTAKQSSSKIQNSIMTSQKLLTNKVLTQLASRQEIKFSNATSKQQSPAVQQVDINKRINQLTQNLVKYD